MAGNASKELCKYSQANEFGEWRNNYDGIVDGKNVGMTLAFHGTEIGGQVFVAPDYKNVEVIGQLDSHGTFDLKVQSTGAKISNVFHGKFTDLVNCDKMSGYWSNSFGSIPADEWNLSLRDAISVAAGANYYSNIGVSDDGQVDDNALLLQEAILVKDKQAVAKMVAYPLDVRMNGRNEMIKDKKEFIASYDSIFTPYMLTEISTAVPHHMFAKNGRALFTSTIWLDSRGKLSSIYVTDEPLFCELAKRYKRSIPSTITKSTAKKLEKLYAMCSQQK